MFGARFTLACWRVCRAVTPGLWTWCFNVGHGVKHPALTRVPSQLLRFSRNDRQDARRGVVSMVTAVVVRQTKCDFNWIPGCFHLPQVKPLVSLLPNQGSFHPLPPAPPFTSSSRFSLSSVPLLRLLALPTLRDSFTLAP
ncbi:hypothetical protein DPEC_G00028880 [Dallia pectoralis]|uniref:Uncharacterized protein n=1 Tax=Dallia pectoralis TaxID=75939 RepID=A0ACC2HI34_DALPE|nr:hypothetical protein DPEC_G00028880 [Dallia pectoralis]